jgi:hypothetical protein
LREPDSAELQKLKENLREKILNIPCELEPRTGIDIKMVKLHFEKQSKELCQKIGIDYEFVRRTVEAAIAENRITTLILDDQTIAECFKSHPTEILLVIVELTMNFESLEAAHHFAKQALSISPDDVKVLIMSINSLLRQK